LPFTPPPSALQLGGLAIFFDMAEIVEMVFILK